MHLTKLGFSKFGHKSLYDPLSSIIVDKKLVEFGDYVFCGPKLYISANLRIDDYTAIGPGVTFIGGNHSFGVRGELNRFLTPKSDEGNVGIRVGMDCWIGANATILPGVIIGDGAIVGAGSIVTKTVEPFTVVAGNPARCIRTLYDAEDEHIHREEVAKRVKIVKGENRRKR